MKKSNQGTNRRGFLKSGALIAGGTILASAIGANKVMGLTNSGLLSDQREQSESKPTYLSRRKLGASLEVSSIGLGVQNMSRTYQTTIPSRKEMHNIIRTAYEHGVTLFDAAEAYGPWEVEKILGEAVSSFRDKIVIETKFGWNINQETRQFMMGLNSKPDHIKKVVEGMLKRLRTDRIDLLYQHRVDRKSTR